MTLFETRQKHLGNDISTLEALPNELLEYIFDQLCNADGRPTPWLVMVASMSRRLRDVAEKLLFRTISVNFSPAQISASASENTMTILDFLSQNTQFAANVRSLELSCSLENVDKYAVEKFKALLPQFIGLKYISVPAHANEIISILEDVKPSASIAFDSTSYWRTWDQRLHGTTWLNRFKNLPNISSLSVLTEDISQLQQLFDLQPRLNRLILKSKDLDYGTVYPDLPKTFYEPLPDRQFILPPLQYLRIDGLLGLQTTFDETEHHNRVTNRIAFLNCVQWDRLQSLDLNSGITVERFLNHYGDRLSTLHSLSLWPYEQDNMFKEYAPAIEATARFLETSPGARRLRSLHLHGYSRSFSFRSFKSLELLQSLRILSPQWPNRSPSTFDHLPSDIHELAQNCPSLLHLAISCPEMRSMLHRTLTPDDINITLFVQAIASMPRLSHLHLLPLYMSYDRDGNEIFEQPFPGDRFAIRLFSYIKAYQAYQQQKQLISTESQFKQQSSLGQIQSFPSANGAPLLEISPSPGSIARNYSATASSLITNTTAGSLTHLYVSSTFHFASYVSDSSFCPQSWLVYGPRTLPISTTLSEPTSEFWNFESPPLSRFCMTLRQAGKDREHRQLWKGEKLVAEETRMDKVPMTYVTGFLDGAGTGAWKW